MEKNQYEIKTVWYSGTGPMAEYFPLCNGEEIIPGGVTSREEAYRIVRDHWMDSMPRKPIRTTVEPITF